MKTRYTSRTFCSSDRGYVRPVIARSVLLAAALLAASCSDPAPERSTDVNTTAPTVAPTPTPIPTRAPTPTAPQRVVTAQPYTPFATVGGVTLRHPSSRVERVGFHEANHDGARTLEPLPTVVAPVTLETRHRETGSHTAADVVSDPAVEIRASVSGRVIRAGTYVLYCRYSDVFVVIEPDDHPAWEVKALHMVGLRVSVGQRVTAGETVLADGPRKLAFESDVDKVAKRQNLEPWPHIHVEVVDPSIPDRPSPGGGCG
jgi:hypothetical protein